MYLVNSSSSHGNSSELLNDCEENEIFSISSWTASRSIDGFDLSPFRTEEFNEQSDVNDVLIADRISLQFLHKQLQDD